MGGQEGSRGYLYQAIAAVLKSIREDNWNMVQMEPKTDEDKVDILFEYENNIKKVIQVKSSINNFTKSQILIWFKQLIIDCKDAETYEVILIGTCSDDTKKFINSMKKLHDGCLDKSTEEVYSELDDEIKNVKDKLEITLINNDLNGFEANISMEFMRFLNSKGYGIDSDTLELIVGAINYQYGVFSTNGSYITRTEFEEKVLQWVNVCYPKLSSNVKKKTSLSIEFYRDGEFKKEISKIQKNLRSCNFIKEKLNKLMIDYKNIEKIKIKEVIKTSDVDPQEGKNLNNLLNNSYMNQLLNKSCMKRKVEFSNCLIDEIDKKCKMYLGISINSKDFFCLGGLEESTLMRPIIPGISTKKELYGTEEEKNKYELINGFYFKLRELEEYLNTFTYIDNFKLIPLVLRNLGEQYDEKIKVQIEIPKSVKIIYWDNIIEPNEIIIENFIGYNGIAYTIFSPEEDSYVNGYEYKYSPIPVFTNPLKNYETEVKELKREFRNTIKSLFDYTIHQNLENVNIFEFNFKELKAKENIHFPVYVAVESNDDFEINYKITSKQLGNTEKGLLKYKVNI